MPFWSDASTGVKDPKRNYRWVVYVNDIPAYTLKKVTKPSYAISETEHKFLNHSYYYPGRVTWNTISMTLADPVDVDMAMTVTNIIRTSGYIPAMGYPGTGEKNGWLETMSKSKAVNALGNELRIESIDDMGKMIETWKLINPWIKDVKYGELDYESDDLTNVEIEIRYDWASIETANPPFTASKDQKQWGLDGRTDSGTSPRSNTAAPTPAGTPTGNGR